MSRAGSIDRRGLFTSATAAALLAATGVLAHGQPKRGGRLRLALSGASRTDDWMSGQGLFMQIARQGLVFDSLTEIAADGTLRGELATGWTSSDDARRWHFDLRRDVTFHDGAPFLAEDVVASAAGFRGGTVTATGRHQVKFALTDPDPALPIHLADPAFFVQPSHAKGSGIGTGLYSVRHFAPGQQLLTQRVEGHYKDGKAGWFDEVELVSIPSPDVRAQALGEQLIDGADVAEARLVTGLAEVLVHPNTRKPMQAVSRSVAQPARVGMRHPFDDLRAGERWWFA